MTNTEFLEAMKRFGGNLSLLSGTAAMVAEDSPEELKRLDESLESGNKDRARMSAHALKGMLATFAEGGDAVSGLQQVEQAALLGDLTLAKSHLSTIRPVIEQLISKITAFVQFNPVV